MCQLLTLDIHSYTLSLQLSTAKYDLYEGTTCMNHMTLPANYLYIDAQYLHVHAYKLS